MTTALWRELIESWDFNARDSQLIPEGDDWSIWFSCMGRGAGKTLSLTQFAHEMAWLCPGEAGCLAARTLIDVGNVLIGHPKSGILATQNARNPCEVKRVLDVPRIQWANGAYAEFQSSEQPERARGPEYAWIAADEIGTWKRKVDFIGNTTFDNLQFGLRGGPPGWIPRMAIGSTPRNVDAIKDLILKAKQHAAGEKIVGSDGVGRLPGVVLSKGTMYDNETLPPSFIQRIDSRYLGTRLHRQEAEGELLLDTEGAWLNQDDIDALRVNEAPEMAAVCVGVDPALKRKKKSDKTGIGVAGRGMLDGHLYAIADRSCKLDPAGWAQRVVDTCHEFAPINGGVLPKVVAEDNVIGDAIQTLIAGARDSAGIHVIQRTATQAKHKRAEPVIAFYSREQAHIVGHQPVMEDQMTRFTPFGWEGDGSPDEADAHVWAANEIMPVFGTVNWDRWAKANADSHNEERASA